MSISLDTANRISIDSKDTGLVLSQNRQGTLIYTPEGFSGTFVEHTMPHARYSASHDNPASGVAGKMQLESDVRELMATLNA